MPREKALEYGISSLSNVELLALVIKSAYRDKGVIELSEDVIEKAGSFAKLLSLTYEELVSIKGIKKAKAMEILGILEICRRLTKIDRVSEPEINSPEKLVDYLRFSLAYSQQEEFFVIFMNNRGNVIKSEVMFKGSSNSATVGIDEILRKALLLKARGMIIAHNHPSDNCTPSGADIELTTRLCDSCSMMGLILHDHIIISQTGYFSFRQQSMLK
ncbi:MAG: DNA repair protein RadC [Erysipelotrichaceae bacterium]|nr:DNA repair protein RadC [Erysipelotrichaceae bacterium]